jgi:NADPH2:quinone reductase
MWMPPPSDLRHVTRAGEPRPTQGGETVLVLGAAVGTSAIRSPRRWARASSPRLPPAGNASCGNHRRDAASTRGEPARAIKAATGGRPGRDLRPGRWRLRRAGIRSIAWRGRYLVVGAAGPFRLAEPAASRRAPRSANAAMMMELARWYGGARSNSTAPCPWPSSKPLRPHGFTRSGKLVMVN